MRALASNVPGRVVRRGLATLEPELGGKGRARQRDYFVTNSTVSRSLRGSAALRALMLCGAGASAALFAAPAFAQDTQAPATDAAPAPQDDQAAAPEIVVTGTLLRNSATATAAPLTTLTSDDLAKRGLNTVADLLQPR